MFIHSFIHVSIRLASIQILPLSTCFNLPVKLIPHSMLTCWPLPKCGVPVNINYIFELLLWVSQKSCHNYTTHLASGSTWIPPKLLPPSLPVLVLSLIPPPSHKNVLSWTFQFIFSGISGPILFPFPLASCLCKFHSHSISGRYWCIPSSKYS